MHPPWLPGQTISPWCLKSPKAAALQLAPVALPLKLPQAFSLHQLSSHIQRLPTLSRPIAQGSYRSRLYLLGVYTVCTGLKSACAFADLMSGRLRLRILRKPLNKAKMASTAKVLAVHGLEAAQAAMAATFMRPYFYISLQRTISISISRALNGLQLLVSLVNTRPSDMHDWRTLRPSSRALRAASFAQLGVIFFSGYLTRPAALNAAPRAARIARKTRVVGLSVAHTSKRPNCNGSCRASASGCFL